MATIKFNVSIFLIGLLVHLNLPDVQAQAQGTEASITLFDVGGDNVDQVNRIGRKGVIFYDLYLPLYHTFGVVKAHWSGARNVENNRARRQILPDDVFIVPPLPKDVDAEGGLTTFATKIPEAFVNQVIDNLSMRVTLYPLCDNYDRLGLVILNLVDKGTVFPRQPYVWTFEDVENHPYRGQTFTDDRVGVLPNSYRDNHRDRAIEIARWVTPFMDRNRQPNVVRFEFEMNQIGQLLGDANMRSRYDFWIEFRQEGVPYDANVKVSGCRGNDDVWKGYIELTTRAGTGAVNSNNHFLHVMKTYETWNNDYASGHTDEDGNTVKRVGFTAKEPIENASLYLITSNHGAGTGGEEYIRREHFVYLDDKIMHIYTPGGKSCEPFRPLNTQGNGIYGRGPHSWDWNNWCPGDKIPTRKIPLGNLARGRYIFKTAVPDAQFKSDGSFPISMYLIGQVGSGTTGNDGSGTTEAEQKL